MSRFVVMVVFVLLMSLLLKSKFVLFDELWTLKTAFKPLVVILSIALETAMLAGEITGPINKDFRLFFSGVGLNVVSVSIKGQVMPPGTT
jgi:hypothetical protein